MGVEPVFDTYFSHGIAKLCLTRYDGCAVAQVINHGNVSPV